MGDRDVIVVGASAGGIETLRIVLAGLPPELPASVLVVLHMPASGGTALPRILGRCTPLQVGAAEDGEPLRHGRVYCCVPDHHLLVGEGQVLVRRGPREDGHRPAVDPLFRSAAAYAGQDAIGVVLSGTLSDGTAGLAAIRRRGGIAVVQDPVGALYGGMPSSAIAHAGADHIVTAEEVGPLLARLAGSAPDRAARPPLAPPDREVLLMERDDSVVEHAHPGVPSAWPCPDCSGVLWEVVEGDVLRFRCRVGHAWSADALLHEQGHSIDAALWMALRALEDRAALGSRLARQAEEAGRSYSAQRFRDNVTDIERNVDVIRRLLHGPGEPAEVTGG